MWRRSDGEAVRQDWDFESGHDRDCEYQQYRSPDPVSVPDGGYDWVGNSHQSAVPRSGNAGTELTIDVRGLHGSESDISSRIPVQLGQSAGSCFKWQCDSKWTNGLDQQAEWPHHGRERRAGGRSDGYGNRRATSNALDHE